MRTCNDKVYLNDSQNYRCVLLFLISARGLFIDIHIWVFFPVLLGSDMDINDKNKFFPKHLFYYVIKNTRENTENNSTFENFILHQKIV